MTKRLILAATLLTFCSYSFAGSPDKNLDAQNEAAALHAMPDTSACAYSFSSGANNTYLGYCVTVNGNITQLETPAGHEHINVGTLGEGYGICDATSIVEYHDYAYEDSGNWGPATTLSHNATSVKIARTTSDGIWTLTQTISQVAATPAVKIVMALKNNTAVARNAYLVRYADVDADGSEVNNLDATQNTAAGWNPLGTGAHNYGLQLQNVGTPQFGYWQGFALNTYQGPNACAFAYNSLDGTLIGYDGSLVMGYVDNIAKKASKTVTLNYRGM